MKNVSKDNEDIFYSLTAIEKEIFQLAQYGRRESIEIMNIPSKYDDKLEETVIKILKTIGMKDISSYKIVAVHRLKRKTNSKFLSAIVRFLNQKDAFSALRNKRNLSSCRELIGIDKLYMSENLCPVYSSLLDRCNDLKSDGVISSTWFHNGIVNIKFSSNTNEKPTKLLYEEDLKYFFQKDEYLSEFD